MKSVAIWSRLLSLVTFLFARPASADQPGEQDLLLQVELRPLVTADIEAHVLVNPDHPSGGRTFVLLHGLAHTGDALRPLVEAVFANKALKASRAVLLSLPGHGGSSLPQGQGVLFGDLTLDDDAAALIGALDALAARGLRPDVLVGHSMGAGIVEHAQDRLIDDETDFRTRFGIKEVVLLASTIPNAVPPNVLPWDLADSGAGAAFLAPLVILSDPILGPHLSIPPAVWPGLFFTNTIGDLAPGAPSAADVVAQGYIAPEALTASLEMLGAGGWSRPTVGPGIFGRRHGSEACVIAFSEDIFIAVDEEMALYRYLTGDTQYQRFVLVTRSDAVHDMLISAPDAVASAMETCSK
ncbi:alpha/beta fold hydrolase [Polyangium jinanense]|uniref:Alpha/beta fold hydrolase n=1 Tax=Polyangium jinanense TaxID=2829994 RepID=A0A9X3WZG2_9BACT|nr:alpha/beta hydrolase [Polyangium jinanense]MDC3979588.1 alpha/beta fold hydrolase [Polyangium jinanense]